jgi:hypothetical protein
MIVKILLGMFVFILGFLTSYVSCFYQDETDANNKILFFSFLFGFISGLIIIFIIKG